jgi:exosortase
MEKQMTPRNILFIFFNVIAIVMFYAPMKELITLSFHNELYSHIVLIPLISGYFIYSARKKIFSNMDYSFTAGSILIFIGIILYLTGRSQGGNFNQNDYLSLMTFAALVFWLGGFALFYGLQSLRNARFPFLFLIFMIPIPTLILEKIILLLLKGSAETAYGIFNLTGVPIYREGFIFHLPGVSVEVAEQCSGIRSSIALFITSILAGHFFLKTGWRKGALSLAVFPITIFKNAVRIVTLTLLSVYVDESFLTDSFLHRNGGIFFFILALSLLVPILWLLRKSERNSVNTQRPSKNVVENTVK